MSVRSTPSSLCVGASSRGGWSLYDPVLLPTLRPSWSWELNARIFLELLRPVAAVERAVLDGLRNVRGTNGLGILQVGDRTRHLQDAVVGPSTESQAVHGGFQQPLALGGRCYSTCESDGSPSGQCRRSSHPDSGLTDAGGRGPRGLGSARTLRRRRRYAVRGT